MFYNLSCSIIKNVLPSCDDNCHSTECEKGFFYSSTNL